MSTSIYECGDGVPTSIIVERSGSNVDAQPSRGPGSRGASIAVGVLGQGFLAGVVALGGDPVIGVIASLMTLVCSLILVLAESSNRRTKR